ncbi:MAG: hypothetical protein E6K78_11765 [Candidatus Eisenbacteria bacterium]|uniref:ABC transmembrane type-1 domain-containing protein n=1 Tax=Eiseniibacteriota bacterium TaxID=2212470 RepID=A0A538TFM1_UNCEI|nr:MAG: hypothetical protein E6K78_11765 [Candidatus Eisenbacteria bacterium]
MSHPDEEHVGRAYDRRLMRRLLGYLSPYRGAVAFAVVVALADTLVQLAGPYLTKEAIDHGIRQRDLGHLDHVAFLYLGVLVTGFGLGYLQTQVMQRVGQNIMMDLRMALFRHIQRLPVSYFDRNPVGRIMTRVTNDVDMLNELFTAGVVSIVGDLFTLVGIVIAMVRLNAELMGVTFSVLPLIVVVTLIFRAKVRRSFREIRTVLARMNAFLNENLTGMSTVQILNREPRNFEEFRRVNADHRDANLQAVFYYSVFFPVLELVGALAVSLIVWYGGRQVMWTSVTLGTLVAFIQYTQRFFRPISDLSEKYNILQQAMASSERVFALLDTPVGADVPRSAAPIQARSPRSTAGPRAQAQPPRTAPRRFASRESVAEWSSTACGSPTAIRIGCSRTSRFASSRASGSPSLAPPAPARPRSPACCCASTSRNAGRSVSTAATCGTSTRARSGVAWGWCCRTSSCSRARSKAICASGTRGSIVPPSSARPVRSMPTSSSSACHTATKPRSRSVAPRSQSARSNCSRSPGPSPPIPTCCCSTRRPRASTRTPKRSSRARCND